MNFNATSGSAHQPRKVKRVSDVNAMGYQPYAPQPPTLNTAAPNFAPDNSYPPYTATPPVNYNFNMYANGPQPPSQPQMFAQPIVQDMAMQYGQQLANVGKAKVKAEIERYVPVGRLKYYFAVDTKYVCSKLGLLFFPFTHSDWSIKYEQDGPVQPRYELNAPDLYIPTMAYVTYVLVAGLVLGMQQKFSPEQIGIQASSALAWCILEVLMYSCVLYVINIETKLRMLDLLAYSGYKFVGIIFSILTSLTGSRPAYYLALIYTGLALAFLLVRSLKAQVLPEQTQETQYYGQVPTGGNKRRLYFLLFIAVAQPVLSWWLSFHLLAAVGDSVGKV